MDFAGSKILYAAYQRDAAKCKYRVLSRSYFHSLWQKQMRRGVTDPATGVHYTTLTMKNGARGFTVCDKCSFLKAKIMRSKTKTERAVFCRRLDAHYEIVQSDREELARIARKCVVDDEHFGFFIDAVDSQKFGIPTTASQAKCLAGMRRVKQKLTGVQLFNDDGLLLFRTLPDVKTGGNLTLTIIGFMLQKFVRDSTTTDLYINFDGASDNICYTVVYGLAHYLYCAAKSGWRLKRIHVLRFQVGHTHNMLDSTFGVLSRHVYGKHGTTARDLLSFPGFNSVSDDMHANLYVSHITYHVFIRSVGRCSSINYKIL